MFTKMQSKVGGAADFSYPYNISQSCMYDVTSATRNRRNAIGAASTQGVLSVWVKRSAITGSHQGIYSSEGSSASNNNFYLRFTSIDQLALLHDQASAIKGEFNTVRYFRDMSSWYHIFLWIDTNEVGGNDDRLKLWINGILEPLTWTDALPFENAINFCRENSAFGYRIENDNGYFNGYMSQAFYLHDGVLDISNFGEFKNGIWVPKDLTALAAAFDDDDGASFFLDFADSSLLGKDVGAHGNDFSQANMSTDHQVTDSPTNNHAILNSVEDYGNYHYIRDGGLWLQTSNSYYMTANATHEMLTGKWYCEFTSGGGYNMIGIIEVNDYMRNYYYPGYYDGGIGYYYNGYIYIGANGVPYGAAYTTNDVMGMAYDADAGTIHFYKNNVDQGEIEVARSSKPKCFGLGDGSSSSYGTGTFNFGQRPFIHTPPEGYLAVNTVNLPEPAILKPNNGIDVITWTGTGGTGDSVTGYIDVWDAGFGFDNPDNAVDGSEGTFAKAGPFDISAYIQCDSGNTITEGQIEGPISKVELRFMSDRLGALPSSMKARFDGVDGDSININSATEPWSAWYDITEDSTAPETWTWSDVETLGVNITTTCSGASDYFQLYKIEVRVTMEAEAHAITGLNFQPDFLWIKDRTTVKSHCVVDSVRGPNKILYPDATVIEAVDPEGVKSFDSGGFTLGTLDRMNGLDDEYVAWCLKKGPEYGFDIVEWQGEGGTSQEISHNLGGYPGMMIYKNRDTAAYSWIIWHHRLMNAVAAENYYLTFTSNAQTASASAWNNTYPTSSVFTVGIWGAQPVDDWNIAYLFRSIPGFSKCFSFVGYNSVIGPYVHCGFRPRWILFKDAEAAGSWILLDTVRDISNPMDTYLQPSEPDIEGTSIMLDGLANGFKMRLVTASNMTYIGIAFAEQPFKYSNAR